MRWVDLEKAFTRALLLSISKKKLLLAFPAIVLCSLVAIVCGALGLHASEWMAMSLGFLAYLLSSGLLLTLGVLIIRLHHHESKQKSLPIKDLIYGSLDLLIGTSYLSIVPVLAYLFLWGCFGLFILLQKIPLLGNLFSILFAFGPFLLIFIALLLCMFNIALLFFVAPPIALQSLQKVSLLRRLKHLLDQKFLSCLVLFFIALFPIFLVGGLLCIAAALTQLSFIIETRFLGFAIEWFLIMVPFSAILSPAVVFFFNFAAESYQILQKVDKEL